MNHMLNPANMKIKTVESSETRAKSSALLRWSSNAKKQKINRTLNPANMKAKAVESSEYENQA